MPLKVGKTAYMLATKGTCWQHFCVGEFDWMKSMSNIATGLDNIRSKNILEPSGKSSSRDCVS